MVHHLDVGDLVDRGQQVIHEGAGQQLAVVVVGENLIERGADAVRDAAIDHAVDDVGIDHRAAVMADEIFQYLDLTGLPVDLDQRDVGLEGIAGIHPHPPVGVGQLAALGDFPDVARLQAGLHAKGHLVIFAMGDLHQLIP